MLLSGKPQSQPDHDQAVQSNGKVVEGGELDTAEKGHCSWCQVFFDRDDCRQDSAHGTAIPWGIQPEARQSMARQVRPGAECHGCPAHDKVVVAVNGDLAGQFVVSFRLGRRLPMT